MVKEMTFDEFKEFMADNTVDIISITDKPHGTLVRAFEGYKDKDKDKFFEAYKDRWGESRVVDYDGQFLFIYNPRQEEQK